MLVTVAAGALSGAVAQERGTVRHGSLQTRRLLHFSPDHDEPQALTSAYFSMSGACAAMAAGGTVGHALLCLGLIWASFLSPLLGVTNTIVLGAGMILDEPSPFKSSS